MNARLAVLSVVAAAARAGAAQARPPVPGQVSEVVWQSTIESYGKLPLSFEPNQGQAPAEVKFLSRGRGYTLWLTAEEAVLELSPGAKGPGSVLRMTLPGASAAPEVEGRDLQPGRSNYFIGSDPAGWHTNIPNYARVTYRRVYPGVDLVYHGNERHLEFDFVVVPGAAPGLIQLKFEGARRMRVEGSGDLVVSLAGSEEQVRFQKPVLYQEVEGVRRRIRGRYVVRGWHQVGFAVGSYDKARRLVIDPALLYSTYLGGSRSDSGNGIAVDSSGSAYVTGQTTGSFPTTGGAHQTAYGGGTDAFVTKLNAAGSALAYSTYLGGGGEDIGTAIAVDASGNAYVTGQTTGRFPTTKGAYQTAYGGITDAFVTKLNAAGSALAYSTYLGGTGNEFGFGIALDSSGNAYVTGLTTGGFPTTGGAYHTAYGGGLFDAYVTKLNAAGSALAYSTYLGGSGEDIGRGIAVDSSGNAYVTGLTTGNFPTTGRACQTTYGGSTDAFVTKLNAAGSALAYSTYLGGSGDDVGRGVAVDSSGNAYVTGQTTGNFPTTDGAYQSAYGVGTDAFVTKLNAAGSALAYSTYLGGKGIDQGFSIAVDSSGNAYVTGQTTGNFPTTDGAYQTAYGGGTDAFVTKLNAAGSALAYSTYLGGSGDEVGTSIAVDSSGNAYVTGQTTGKFPITGGAYHTTYGGGLFDAFVAKLGLGMRPPRAATLNIAAQLQRQHLAPTPRPAQPHRCRRLPTAWSGALPGL